MPEINDYDEELVAAILKLDKEPPEAIFDNIEDLLKWLDDVQST